MVAEAQKGFSLIRTALSTCGRAKRKSVMRFRCQPLRLRSKAVGHYVLGRRIIGFCDLWECP